MLINLDVEYETFEKLTNIKEDEIPALFSKALDEYVTNSEKYKVLDLFGSIEYDDNYNYKELRNGSENFS